MKGTEVVCGKCGMPTGPNEVACWNCGENFKKNANPFLKKTEWEQVQLGVKQKEIEGAINATLEKLGIIKPKTEGTQQDGQSAQPAVATQTPPPQTMVQQPQPSTIVQPQQPQGQQVAPQVVQQQAASVQPPAPAAPVGEEAPAVKKRRFVGWMPVNE